ncbi:MAG: hypothetical protein J6X03_03505, partial [Bacilli bacterium]|nr:hypothetical protein [Bacilli bacterium]
KSYWKKHKIGLEVVLKMKHENLIRILDIFKTNKIQVDNRIRQTLLDMDPKCFAELDTEESKKCRNDLSVIRDEIFYIANQNGHIVVNEEFLLAKENVLEQDVLFRKCLAMYNADVLGYNYWAQFKPCRFIYKFFKVKEKEII